MIRLTLAVFALAVIAAWLGLLYTSARLNSTPSTVGAAVLGVVAAEHGVLHVRMPDGALERVKVHDPEGLFVVGGLVTVDLRDR